jgi:hypothetical protein
VDVIAAILTLVLLALVVIVVTGPLRSRRHRPDASANGSAAPAADEQARLAELEAAREAKYQEIRDAELDLRTGKLSAADHARIDAQLRREALEILDRLERRPARAPTGSGPGPLQQDDRVDEEQHREEDRPAVEVTLHHRAPAERSGAAADAERAGQAGVLPRVHQHQEHEDHGDRDLEDR